jgi:hypothetical protein
LFITDIIRFIKSFNKFVIFFIRLFIIRKDTKPFLLIKKILRHIKKIYNNNLDSTFVGIKVT